MIRPSFFHQISTTKPATTAAPAIQISVRIPRFFNTCRQVWTKGMSSVPGMIHSLLCPTHSLSMTNPSYQFITSRNSRACQYAG